MTVDEAINYFKTNPTPRNLWHPAYDVAIEALEKQIPKKPIDEYHRTAYCPACGNLIIDAYCCPECGQKIDWSEE